MHLLLVTCQTSTTSTFLSLRCLHSSKLGEVQTKMSRLKTKNKTQRRPTMSYKKSISYFSFSIVFRGISCRHHGMKFFLLFFPTVELDTCILTANEKDSTLRIQFLIKTAEKRTAVED